MTKETFAAECRENDIRWNDMVEIGIWRPRTFLGITIGYDVKYFTGALGYGYHNCFVDHAPYGDYVQLCTMKDEHSSDTVVLCFEFEQILSIKLITH